MDFVSVFSILNKLMNTTWNTCDSSSVLWDSEGTFSVFKYINITSYRNLNIKPISYRFWDAIHHLPKKFNIPYSSSIISLEGENSDNTCWTRITIKIWKSDRIHSATSLSDLLISIFFQISYQVFPFSLCNASRDHFCSRDVFLGIHQVLCQHLSPADAFALVGICVG